ncbi:cytochrome C assembly family protein [Caldalkalibacillus mannanilyticus]|uniref:cytochrome C assembly family protein n=1 Tax=Caldalkalibacillus mannanilyticus TaxID=1418 RepID=UPI000468945D|nr:cytochrome c biogenesis protein CcsA [Caldalkalibacillus mannanilyticus]
MFEQIWYYELLVVLYASSVLLYFYDFLQNNRKANQFAFWLLSIVWVIQTVYIGMSAIQKGILPLFSQFDTLFFYAWLLITLSLLINWFFRMDLILFFTNVIGFTVLSLSLFVAGREIPAQMAEQLSSEWLLIHISMAFISYAAFTFSFIFSSFYLVQHSMLKKKKWTKHVRRLPSLVQLDLYTFRLNLIGVPLLLLSLILGIVWGYYTLDASFLYDPKVIFSILVLLMYGVYLYQRVVKGWSGRRIVELNIICFLVLLINYLLASIFSKFHLWM